MQYVGSPFCLLTRVQSAIIYVDNDVSRLATYRTIQAAVDAATNGNTAIVDASSLAYSGAYVGKQLFIRGSGFGGDAMPNQIGAPLVAKIQSTLTIGGGWSTVDRISANGTIVEGLRAAEIRLNASNCVVRRCATTTILNVRGAENRIEGCLRSSNIPGNPNAVALNINDDIIINNQSVAVTDVEVWNCIIQEDVYCRYFQGSTDFRYCTFRCDAAISAPAAVSVYMKNSRFFNCIFGNGRKTNVSFQTRDVAPLLMRNRLFLDNVTIMGNGSGAITGSYSATFIGQGQWGGSLTGSSPVHRR